MSTRPDGILVRSGGVNDLGAVVRIERLSFADPWSQDALLIELLPDSKRITLVAERGREVVGYLMAWLVVDQLHVLNLATQPAARRAGVAAALLREAARQGLERGLLEVTLEVRRSNQSARNFYLKHGLREVGVRVRYYQDNGEDAILMTGPLADLVPAGEGTAVPPPNPG